MDSLLAVASLLSTLPAINLANYIRNALVRLHSSSSASSLLMHL